MFTSPIRFILISFSLISGVYLLTQQVYVGIFLLLSGALWIFGYFRYGSVWVAFRAFNKGDLEQARKISAQVRNPQLLNSQHRAYYDWILGGLAASDGDLETAYRLLLQASKGNLRTQNDKSVVQYVLSDVARHMGNLSLARGHLENARSTPHRPQFDSALAELAQQLDEA